ncbi:MAG: hypothetical protein H8E55_05350 [Pelagibacterales bacterium]|nr:hypothetical protein [Pelagibacterales bacterium]
MSYIAKWIVKNTKKDINFNTVSHFFNEVENDESIMEQHIFLSHKYAMDKGGYIAFDRKSILYWMEFKDEDTYKEYINEFYKLPAIDIDLEYTKVSEIDPKKYFISK